jgi:hypothetical protein
MGQSDTPQWYTQSMTEAVADLLQYRHSHGEPMSFREAVHILCSENDMIEVYDRYMTGDLDLDNCIVDVFNDGSIELFDPNRKEEDDD